MITHRIERTNKELRVFSFDSEKGELTTQVLEGGLSDDEVVSFIQSRQHYRDNERIIKNKVVTNAFSAPFKIYIDITDACQLDCKHCLTKLLNKGNEIPFDTLKAISKECYDMGVFYVKLGGGEPLLHKDFPRILELFKNSGQALSLSTNGYLVTDEIAELLYKYKVRTTVSIEGPEIIDSEIRGKGHFACAINALEKLKSHNVNVCLRVTLTKKILVVAIIEELIRIAKDKASKIKFSYCRPAGSSIDNELLIGYEDRDNYKQVIEYLNLDENKELVVLDEGMMLNQPKILYLTMYDERICGCLNKSMHINSTSKMSPCVFLGPDFVLDKLYYKGMLRDYWEGLLDERVNMIRSVIMPNLCSNCERLCKYECLATRLYFNNDFDVSDPNCLNTVI